MRDCDTTQRALEAHGTGTALGDPIEVVSSTGVKFVFLSFVLGRGGYRSLVCGLAVGPVRISEVEHGSLGAIGGCRWVGLARVCTPECILDRYERAAQAVWSNLRARLAKFRAHKVEHTPLHNCVVMIPDALGSCRSR